LPFIYLDKFTVGGQREGNPARLSFFPLTFRLPRSLITRFPELFPCRQWRYKKILLAQMAQGCWLPEHQQIYDLVYHA
jgi:hypothetical protein